MRRNAIKKAFVILLIISLALQAVSCDLDVLARAKGVYILFTSDIHCGIDEGYGFVGLKHIRDDIESQGYKTILVDNGDAIQGNAYGMLTQGQSIIGLMNKMKYDVAVPGNHEFEYGVDRFMELAGMADFPYISCNFRKNGELVFKPYVIKEAAGIKIAFVGISTPSSLNLGPKKFQDEDGNFIYDFMGDDSCSMICEAVQSAVDQARAEGADYVYALGHIGGNANEDAPWLYQTIIGSTRGIDVFLDGHSHDREQCYVKNKDGVEVLRSACGTRLNAIGYSVISKDDGITKTSILTWDEDLSYPEKMNITNSISDDVEKVKEETDTRLGVTMAVADYDLMFNDPEKRDDAGNPVDVSGYSETNLGDLFADAYRVRTGADIAVFNSGSFKNNILKGAITLKDIYAAMPYSNQIMLVEVTGQQVLDSLEWSVRAYPEPSLAFLQVSGMTYEIDGSIPSPCYEDDKSNLLRIEGNRRIRNVTINDEPIDPNGKYTLAVTDYIFISHGNGQTAYDGARVINDSLGLDRELLIDYLSNELGYIVGELYSYPQGRIIIAK